jgi:GNAT superfamily N-acetyltransferase
VRIEKHFPPRTAIPQEVDRLAELWFDAWQDAHAAILPGELKQDRTLESFRARLEEAFDSVRVVGEPNEPIGFSIVKNDELYQLYVARSARGSGIAAILMADAEQRIKNNGAKVGWLACAIGNDRAARFYEKCGWRRIGTMLSQLETAKGIFPLEVWRYEKVLRP